MNKEEIKNTTYNPEPEGNIMKDNRTLQTKLTEANEKLEKIKEYCNKELTLPFTSICDYEQGARDAMATDILEIIKGK